MDVNRTCANCKFWHEGFATNSARIPEPPDGFGECRRNAPRGPITWMIYHRNSDGTLSEVSLPVTSGFSGTSHEDWCGDHTPKENES